MWIQQNWLADHPDDSVLSRLISTELYPDKRYIFANDLLPATRNVIGSKVKRAYQATHGHIVVRVLDKGKQYLVIVLNDTDAERKVLSVFGPFQAR